MGNAGAFAPVPPFGRGVGRRMRVGVALLAVAAHLGVAAWAWSARQEAALSELQASSRGVATGGGREGQLVWLHLPPEGAGASGPSERPALVPAGRAGDPSSPSNAESPLLAPHWAFASPHGARTSTAVQSVPTDVPPGPSARPGVASTDAVPMARSLPGGASITRSSSASPEQAGALPSSPSLPASAAVGAMSSRAALPDGVARPAAGNALPAYPEAAREDGLEGTVRLLVDVDAQGHVQQVQWQERSGVMLLDVAARDAVRHWRFVPARRAGVPVAGQVSLSLRFELDAGVRWLARAGDGHAAFLSVPH